MAPCRRRFGILAFSSILLLLCSSSVVKSVELDLRQSELEALELDLENEGGDSDGNAEEEEEWDGFEGEDGFPSGNEYGLEEFIQEEDEEGAAVDDPHLLHPDDDVSILSLSNFTEFISGKAYVMVAFVAPWCGHCKALAPEFSAAATHLKASTNVSFAKVDATEETQLSQLYNVQGYPTLLFFIHGQPKIYSLLRNSEAIISWVEQKLIPAVTELSSVRDADVVLESGKTIVIALFDKLEGPEVEAFGVASRQEDDVVFYHTKSKEIAEIFHIKQVSVPALALIKNLPEKVVHYDGKFESALLSDFVASNKLPLVIPFSKETSSSIFESSIKRQLILFAHPESADNVLLAFETASRSFKKKIIFVHVDPSNEEAGKPVVEFFGVTGDKATLIAFHASPDRPIKYLFEDEFTPDKIKEFASAFVDGKLKEFFKSQPIPETNDGAVTVVVGKNFDDIVLDESRDVLLEIYAPWCGHCQTLEPIYEKLAKVLRGVNSLVIAKMDGTTNEHPRGKPDGYPTILFYPAGNKSFDPITVESDRTVKALYQFLKKNAAIPFTLPKTRPIQSQAHPTEPSKEVQEPAYDVKEEL